MSKIKTYGNFTALKLMLLKYRKVYVVYDSNVREYAEKIASGHPSMEITADEDHKNMDTVLSICRWLLSRDAGRDALVLAVGGGVTTDTAGFAAGIYKRGVRYATVPTTLLSMVDAGIGGKTGVNLDDLKNMLGLIKQPEFTYICPEVLKTLPEREFKSGAAELLKTFLIRNEKGNYSKALTVLSGPLDIEALTPLVKSAAKIKLGIVKKDPTEKGLRRVLNLGHTYAHALEWWQRANSSPNPLTHGEAVAIGIVTAALKSEEKGVAKPGLAEKLRADFSYCGLPTALPCTEAELEEAMKQDKKVDGGKLNMVLIRDVGKVIIKKI